MPMSKPLLITLLAAGGVVLGLTALAAPSLSASLSQDSLVAFVDSADASEGAATPDSPARLSPLRDPAYRYADWHEHPEGGPGGPPPGGEFGPGMEGPMHEMHALHRLDLSEVQHDKIFELMYAEAPVVRNLFKQVREAQKDLDTLARSDHFDAPRARDLADQGAKALAALAVKHAETLNKVLALLTPDQRKHWNDEMARHHGPDHERGGPGEHEHGGPGGHGHGMGHPDE